MLIQEIILNKFCSSCVLKSQFPSSLELKDSKQILSITKSFKVENIGALPVTVTALKINGYNCQGYGFEVLDCPQFSLGPNTSRDISIV